MADYIDGIKIAELEELTDLSEDDLFIGEDSEDTKKLTLATLIKALPGVKNIDVYFGKSASPTKYPSLIEEETSILGNAVLGKALLGDSGEWTNEPPHLDEEEYLWARLFLTYMNGTEVWSDPWCLTDETVKNAILELREQIEALKDSTEKDYAALKESIENVSSSLSEKITQTETSLTEKIDNGNEEIESLKTRVTKTESDITDANTKINNVETQANENKTNIATINEQIENILKQLYPIGSVYLSINDTSPADIIGGTWESVDIELLVASGEDQMYMWKRIS